MRGIGGRGRGRVSEAIIPGPRFTLSPYTNCNWLQGSETSLISWYSLRYCRISLALTKPKASLLRSHELNTYETQSFIAAFTWAQRLWNPKRHYCVHMSSTLMKPKASLLRSHELNTYETQSVITAFTWAQHLWNPKRHYCVHMSSTLMKPKASLLRSHELNTYETQSLITAFTWAQQRPLSWSKRTWSVHPNQSLSYILILFSHLLPELSSFFLQALALKTFYELVFTPIPATCPSYLHLILLSCKYWTKGET
jgi:hypothetical protein